MRGVTLIDEVSGVIGLPTCDGLDAFLLAGRPLFAVKALFHLFFLPYPGLPIIEFI
jgi:hypothetical protein